MIYPCIAFLKGAIVNDPELAEYLENPDKYNSGQLRKFLEEKYGITFWPDRLFHNDDGMSEKDEFIMVVLYNEKEYRSLQISGYNNRFADFFKPLD